MACRVYAPNKEHAFKLAQNYALNKKYALNSEECLTTSFYGVFHNIIIIDNLKGIAEGGTYRTLRLDPLSHSLCVKLA